MVEVQVFGAKASAGDIATMGTRAMAMQPAFGVIRELILKGFAANFDSEGGAFGEAWPPLAESTIKRKGNSNVLEETGKLRAALMGGTGRRSRAGASRLTVGIDGRSLYYARFAQGGTEAGEPKRPIVGISSGAVEESISLIERYLLHGALAGI